MTDPDPPRPRRLPREREPSRRGEAPPRRDRAPAAAPPPGPGGRRARRHDRFLWIPLATLAAIAAIVVVFEARGAERPPRRDPRWNAPPRTDRHAPLADLIAQATVRGRKVVPGAELARLAVRHVDPRGVVDLNVGSVDVTLVAPAAARAPAGDGAPCGVELSVSWHGWRQRPAFACDGRAVAIRCPVGEVLARALGAAAPDDATLELAPVAAGERPDAPADLGVWTVRAAPRAPGHRVIDDCGP